MALFSRKRPEAAAPATVRDTPERVLRRLEWTVLRRLDGLLQGDFRTLWRGAGLDLADLREYQHHDDVRHIDWNVTARLQQPYVRQFHEDREMSAWFLVDLSGSIDFGSGAVKKLRVSSEFVALLARILTRHGNRIGALFYDQGVQGMLPAGGGRLHVLHLLSRLLPRPQALVPAQAKRRWFSRRAAGPAAVSATHLADLLDAAGRVLKRRSTVFLVSDFISEPGWQAPLGRLAQRHDVVVVRVLDPTERRLPDLGLLVMRDAETGEELVVDTSDAGFRARYALAADRREAELQSAFGAAGVDALELATDDDLTEAVLRFVDLRRRRVQTTAGAARPAAALAAAGAAARRGAVAGGAAA
jgi:uncharacterized protein (DUF58 family)